MAREATQLNENANNDYSDYEKTDRGNFQTGLTNYNTQIGKMDAMGNPYQSADYLKNQNLLVSGAMHGADDTAQQALRDTALRTGTNSAAQGATIASNSRQGQMLADQQTAQRATGDQDKYLQWEQGLAGAKLAGTQAAGSMYSTDAQGRSGALNNLQSGQNASEDMWGKIISSATQAAGAAGAAALA